MSVMIVSGTRVHEEHVDAYLEVSQRLRELLLREASGLLYWGVNQSTSEPNVFGGVAIWATQEDERRMVNHPDRLALVAEIAPLIAEKVTGVVGPVVMELNPRGEDCEG